MRVLDLFIGTLVVFPWLTGWIWLDMPNGGVFEPYDWAAPLLLAALIAIVVQRRHWKGALALAGSLALAAFLHRYEAGAQALWLITHGTGAMLIVALAAALVRRWSDEPWEKSFFVRLGRRVAHFWLGAVQRSPARALWSVAAIVGAILFSIALLRHRAFETHGYDLGIFTNAIWNLTHGNGYVSSVKNGMNLFADHQSPTFWLLAPLFWLVPRPETLLFAQAFGLAAGGPAMYYLARKHFGAHWAAAALPWLYWCYLPMRNANAFDFHPEVLMLPLFLWAFAAFSADSRWIKALGVVSLLAALGAKESAPVVATGIGIAWALTGARWRGIGLAALGVAVFFFDVKVAPGLAGAGDYPYMGLYDRFGGSLTDLLLAPFTQPLYFFPQLINRERLIFLFWTLAPLGFLPLFDWRAALAVVPTYLMLFLAEGDQRVRIVFHYGIEPGSALMWALPFGLAVFARRFGWYRAGLWMLFWVVAAYGPGEFERWRSYSPVPHSAWLGGEVIPCIDAQAPIAASDRLIAQIATRPWVSYPDQLEQQPSGEPVSCVFTDLRLGNNWPLGKGGVERVLEGLPAQGYREAWRCGDVSVWQRPEAQCLRCVPDCRQTHPAVPVR